MIIAFEGIDGSGKTTQAKALHSYFLRNNQLSYLSNEPTDSLIGSLIRNYLNKNIEMDDATLALLYAADRQYHLTNKTNGLLAQLPNYDHIILDRYYISSYAYQNAAGLELEWLMNANKYAVSLLKPDVHIYIEIDPILSVQRIGETQDRFETLDRLTKVKSTYNQVLDIMRQTENIIVINGNQDAQDVASDIRKAIQPYINRKA